jgi:hypothetical protein
VPAPPTIVHAPNFLDRTIFNVLIEPTNKEFALSDTTMGLLAHPLPFVFITVFIPAGRCLRASMPVARPVCDLRHG